MRSPISETSNPVDSQVLDLPFTAHWPKLLLFVPYEVCIAVLTLLDARISASGGENASSRRARRPSATAGRGRLFGSETTVASCLHASLR